ncbi:MAG: DUF423 domain-containing protein [Proteobacteria bacterium]|jgi:uncharacterized membrane protein YgdD (TMEM256/DUF423 family)|nr:DUF423 domain-containing protein [Pseudomonadota bacterium]
MEWTIWVAIGAISAALSVACGAFGAHALRANLTPENLAVFETAARYQMYHALALIAVGLLSVKVDSVAVRIAGIAFTSGSVLFSGSLYALVLSNIRALGMITPIGGLGFIVGWCALAVAALKH